MIFDGLFVVHQRKIPHSSSASVAPFFPVSDFGASGTDGFGSEREWASDVSGSQESQTHEGGYVVTPDETLSWIPQGAFFLDSCQRRVWAFFSTSSLQQQWWKQQWSRPRGAFSMASTFDLFHGAEAYAFLLRVACGLESQVAGETEVLGQVKQAWAQCSQKAEPDPLALLQKEALAPVVQKLFEDCKAIRSEYLRGVGTDSYGRWVRRLLEEGHPKGGRILILGAGQLAQELLPWLEGFHVVVTNRDESRARELCEKASSVQRGGRSDLSSSGGASSRVSAPLSVTVWNGQDDEVLKGGPGPLALVSCVPGDSEFAQNVWKRLVAQGTEVVAIGRCLDLGEPSLWSAGGGAVRPQDSWTLQDLFAFQKSSHASQQLEVARAKRACLQRALLREQQATMTFPHGWQDLGY